MKIESIGIIIELKPFSDRDFIGRVFTKDFGIIVGIFKAGQVAKNKPLLGQYGHISWNARLEDQLGSIHFENEKNLTLPFLSDFNSIKFINSAFALLSVFLPERDEHEKLFSDTLKMLENPDSNYLKWEQALLSELGYGLSLDSCGNCGKKESLEFISPKTGRAICKDCGFDYKDKLFSYPINLSATKFFLSGISELPVERQII